MQQEDTESFAWVARDTIEATAQINLKKVYSDKRQEAQQRSQKLLHDSVELKCQLKCQKDGRLSIIQNWLARKY